MDRPLRPTQQLFAGKNLCVTVRVTLAHRPLRLWNAYQQAACGTFLIICLRRASLLTWLCTYRGVGVRPSDHAGSGINGCVGECRPKLVRFTDCNHVTVTGVTLRNSPDWTQLYRRCNDVLLRDITVLGSQLWGNNDGVDFESGERIRVLDSTFITGDDGIVFASGNTNPNRVSSPGLPVRDVIVQNVTISSKSCAIKWEQIDFGKCNHGNLEDMVVNDVRIFNSSRGIGFQQRNGVGDIRNISISNVEISTRYPIGTNWWGSAEPIWLTNVPTTIAEGAPGQLGTLANISFSNISIVSENGILLSGIGRPIGPIGFENVSLTLVDNLGNTTCRKGHPGGSLQSSALV